MGKEPRKKRLLILAIGIGEVCGNTPEHLCRSTTDLQRGLSVPLSSDISMTGRDHEEENPTTSIPTGVHPRTVEYLNKFLTRAPIMVLARRKRHVLGICQLNCNDNTRPEHRGSMITILHDNANSTIQSPDVAHCDEQ